MPPPSIDERLMGEDFSSTIITNTLIDARDVICDLWRISKGDTTMTDSVIEVYKEK